MTTFIEKLSWNPSGSFFPASAVFAIMKPPSTALEFFLHGITKIFQHHESFKSPWKHLYNDDGNADDFSSRRALLLVEIHESSRTRSRSSSGVCFTEILYRKATAMAQFLGSDFEWVTIKCRKMITSLTSVLSVNETT
jgi:hypothetical protein